MDISRTTIATDRLLLAPPSMQYREEIFREFQEPVTEFMYPKAAEKIEETDNFIHSAIDERATGTNLEVVILNKATGEFLGCGGLHGVATETPEFGIWIKKSAHGQKFGREAMTALKNWADQNLKYNYFRYPVVDQNITSRKIPEALGGKIEKEYEKTMLSGRTYHMVEYWIPGNLTE